MRVTTKGQVTIPRNVREVLGITPQTEVEFIEENGRFYIVKTDSPKSVGKFKKFREIATADMSTDEIMELTRDTKKYKTYFPQVKLIHPEYLEY